MPGPSGSEAKASPEGIVFRNDHDLVSVDFIGGCRVALKSETRRVRGYFLPLIMRFDCHRAYAFRALPGDVIDRGKQTWLLIEGAQ